MYTHKLEQKGVGEGGQTGGRKGTRVLVHWAVHGTANGEGWLASI